MTEQFTQSTANGHVLPNREDIDRYLKSTLRYADDDTFFSMRVFPDNGRSERAIHITAVRVDDPELSERAYTIAHRCAIRAEPAVFSPIPSTFRRDSGAAFDDLANGLNIVAELDKHPTASLRKLIEVLGSPTMTIASGGIWRDTEGVEHDKIHAYWRLSEPTRTREDHELLNEARALVSALVDGDATANNAVHPLRIAGSVHRKATPRIVRIIEETDADIELSEAIEILRLAVSNDPSIEAKAKNSRNTYASNVFSDLFYDPEAAIRDVRAALEIIPNDNLEWANWNVRGMTIWNATRGSDEGFEAFDKWSQKSPKYDARRTLDRWEHYFTSPPKKLGFGSLHYLAAQELGGEWRKPSDVEKDAHREAEKEANEARFNRDGGPTPQPDREAGENPKTRHPGDRGASSGDRADHKGGTSLHDDPRYRIDVIAGQLHRVVDEAEEALLQANETEPIFVRGPNLVKPVVEEIQAHRGVTKTAKLKEMTSPAMTDTLSRIVRFERYDKREKKVVQCNPPQEISPILLSREGLWRLPRVSGVITTPTLRRDGSILSKPGYDAATRLYLIDDVGTRLPGMPAIPTRKDAEDALALLDALLIGFPFKSDAARSVALSAIITSVVRGAMNVAPLHVVRAHTRGTGKSYFVDLVSTISAGRPCPVIAAGKTEEETEKRLGALLREGAPLVSIDNVNSELGGSALCQMISQPVMRVRILGRSEAPEFDNRATILATGNNLRLVGDMTRRAILCDLDANMEKPELRAFDFSPIDYVSGSRGDYVAAVLTIVRAYLVAECPNPCPPLGGFEEWSRLVRAPLVWLGMDDPAATMDLAHEEDSERGAIIEVFEQWRAAMTPAQRHSTADVLKVANSRAPGGEYEYPAFREALLAVAGVGGGINSRSLGTYLAGVSGRIVGGQRLLRCPGKVPKYLLERIEEDSGDDF